MLHPLASQSDTLPVLPADALRVSVGAAAGDAMSFADDLVLDDIYEIDPQVARAQLGLQLGPRLRTFRVSPDSVAGTPGAAVHLDCCITLMEPQGSAIEVLVLVEVDGGMVAAVYLLPLSDLTADTPYRLVRVDRHAATQRFAQVACVSFAAGTRITRPDGTQTPVQDLRPGDLVLTRDRGPQPLQWVGCTTLRAQGAFAPVVIRAGAMNNPNDLVLNPDHRILIYQRQDLIGAGRPDVLVKVRHLVDGERILWRPGGFVDYHQLLLDDHDILYAEGIATESLRLDNRTASLLPDDLADSRQPARARYELADTLLPPQDALALLRRASRG